MGTFSEGFRINVLPHEIAKGNIHIGTIARKFNGLIPAHTPSGWRIDTLSMPFETFSSESPSISEGIPQATSTI